MSEERPDDIIVTGVSVDSRDRLGSGVVAEADGEMSRDGSIVTVTVKLGDAVLTLSYDEDNQESATNAAILLAAAGPLVNSIEEAYAEDQGR